MRWGLVLAMAAACGAKAPKRADPVARPTQSKDASDDRRVSIERPHTSIADYIPDFHDELRWPLPAMSHPELEPQFPIARELAINVGWEDLCARGVHKRVVAAKADQLEYLRGWCSVLERNIDAACRHLKPLLLSNLRGMPEAVRRDLANILVGHGDADAAEGFITRNSIRDTLVLDLLAASYAEMGKHEDAYKINRVAIDVDDYATNATKCRRLVKRIVMMPDVTGREFPIEQLRKLGADPKATDPTCSQLTDAVACWNNPSSDCEPHFWRNHLGREAIEVLRVYLAWPVMANSREWWFLAERLREQLGSAGAFELLIAAYEGWLTARGSCTGDHATVINRVIVDLPYYPRHAVDKTRWQRLAHACAQPPAVPSAAPSTTATPIENFSRPRSVTRPVPRPDSLGPSPRP